MATVYLVEDCGCAPGRVLAVFADEEDAEKFADNLPYSTLISERMVYYGQPPAPGYNE